MSWPIVTLPIESEGDVVAVRQRARRIAELLGFERQDQTRIATAVSEIARNAFAYGGGGRAEFAVDATEANPTFRVRLSDNGPGIADVAAILEGRFHSQGGMGIGIAGARRLMDKFTIESAPGKGTVVDLAHGLPKRAAPVTPAKVREIAAVLGREKSADPLVALREQNRELLQSLEEIRRHEDESAMLNRELSDTNRGVVALYAELEGRAEQLREASELKSHFLSNMSHEFRTPLNSIIALARLLIDRVDGALVPEQEKQVEFIRRSAENLLDLVNDLLDLAKVEAGKIDVTLSSFTVQSMFGALRGALRPLRTAAVELIFEAADDIPVLTSDEGKVAQILRNLISNALKFTEAGEVRVVARRDLKDGYVSFAVSDTGIGIAVGDIDRIFEEFSQIKSRLQDRVKGTGLGLPLSRSLAALIGGTVGVESVPGDGSVFTLTIPLVFDETPRIAPPADLDPKTILLVDDDDTFRYVFRQIVANEPRYTLIEASDGEEGLRRARADGPDAIVLDLHMPKLDGFDVLRELAADERTRAIPVIVSSSLTMDEALRARLPPNVKVIAKNLISRDSVASFLRQALEPGDVG
ncbi:MAG TPA: ATP-binding protein [Stellaceae bacterium]